MTTFYAIMSRPIGSAFWSLQAMKLFCNKDAAEHNAQSWARAKAYHGGAWEYAVATIEVDESKVWRSIEQ